MHATASRMWSITAAGLRDFDLFGKMWPVLANSRQKRGNGFKNGAGMTLEGPFVVQGYLANKEHPPPRTLQQDYTWGPLVVLGGGG